MQDDQRINDALWDDPEGGTSGAPEGGFADGGGGNRGLKPIPEDSMRPSMDASNGSAGPWNGEASPPEKLWHSVFAYQSGWYSFGII